MCNLYSMTRPRDEVGKLFKVSGNRLPLFEWADAIFPGSTAPVIRISSDGERELGNMSWGFVLLMDGKAPRRVTNVRDDKIQTSSFWKGSFEERRCLVPASSFSEPKGLKPATWYWFALQGDEPRPLFAFAGIWRRYIGPLKKDGDSVEVDVFAFMTTTPNALVATINHERMPVILTKEEEFAQWLTGTPKEAAALIKQYPPDRMHIVQNGTEKRDKLNA
jgi:putative SOS response-associated peptidase YedK